MKFHKPLLILVSLLLFTCSSDDDGNSIITILPNITLDINAINALPDGSDITDLVNFGQPLGVSTRDWEVELEEGGVLRFEQPGGLDSDNVLFYSRVDYFDPTGTTPAPEAEDVISFIVPDDAMQVEDPNFPGTGFNVYDKIELVAINADDDNDLDYKYDIRVMIQVNGDLLPNYYFIDPKIKIKARN
ncbi:hypothetical protein RM697_09250 [Ichthyenterobacterium sp. W332]|uniref:Lipoprotein n=1 Tax=Microcosmobacter mediterraneus TaxID=3075607 RepID=A0ABU2YKZ3_9FLAO|nr:hypothetical protein [Ichthyenterobacterium sp. W332]MDT0558834.1 hypothetical protein [Ichthyenterobacterium sp. W332]